MQLPALRAGSLQLSEGYCTIEGYEAYRLETTTASKAFSAL